MITGIKVIIIALKQDLIASAKKALRYKQYVESITTISRIADLEKELSRSGANVLLWDLDEFQPNPVLINTLQSRYTLYTLYTAFNRFQANLALKSGNDEFIQKPPLFTPITSERYVINLEKYFDSLAKRQRPPGMRELIKMVGQHDGQKIVVIASSTGGTNALEDVFKMLPAEIPPILVVQHMPSGFTKLFAERLNSNLKQEIYEAQSGDYLMRGRILLAPADRHMRLVRHQGKLAVECFVGKRIHGVMPAADVLFESVAEVMKSNAVGVILTGMGSDGAKGLLQMRAAGCKNIGQDEATCVVYGMPKAAYDLGAIDHVLPLNNIADMIMRLARK